MRLDLKTPTLADALAEARLRDRCLHRGVSARSAVRADQGLSDLRRSDAAKPRTGARSMRGRDAKSWTRRSPGSRRIATGVSSCGYTSSNRTRPTATRLGPAAPAAAGAIRRGDRGSRQPGRSPDRGARNPCRARRSSSRRPIMVKRSASTAKSATAFSCTTRRCACRSSSPDPACQPGGRLTDRVALIDVAPTVDGAIGAHAVRCGRNRPPPCRSVEAGSRSGISTRSRSLRCSISDGARCIRHPLRAVEIHRGATAGVVRPLSRSR